MAVSFRERFGRHRLPVRPHAPVVGPGTSDRPCEPVVLEQPGSGRETRPIRERDRECIHEARFEPDIDASDVTVVTFVAGDGRFADVMFVPDCRTACAIR
jgi:hypothetical protein